MGMSVHIMQNIKLKRNSLLWPYIWSSEELCLKQICS